jgi:hypothetical protein
VLDDDLVVTVALTHSVDVDIRVDVCIDERLIIDVAVAKVWRERPEAQPGGFWADQRPKTGGRSRPNCARRETRPGLAALSI